MQLPAPCRPWPPLPSLNISSTPTTTTTTSSRLQVFFISIILQCRCKCLAGPHDHELKRQYLALLQPHQVIDICLSCDAYVPPYAKSAIWPPDLAATIAVLQKSPEPQPDARPTDEQAKDDAPPIMNSLRSHTQPETAPSIAGPAAEPQPPDKEAAAATEPTATPAIEEPAPPVSQQTEIAPQPSSSESTEASASVPPTDPSDPAAAAGAAAAATPTPAPGQPPGHPQYPPGAYPYGHPQAAYPHAPYYTGYPYQYPSYPPMQPPYQAQSPPASYPAPQPMYPGMVPMQPQPPQVSPPEVMSADDLPSYEEMMVEALTGCGDPEGWVPKDLFAWMASRYPLQSNFRPSASQALQKAFKRGRFEKGSNGKYRLNATWNGGNVRLWRRKYA